MSVIETITIPEGIDRNAKGFLWEKHCNTVLSSIEEIKLTHNPDEFEQWKKENNQNKYDATILLSTNKKINIEYKFRTVNVYHSWFMQCWYDRTADIFIVNNKQCLNYQDIRMLEQRGQKVMTLSEALVYISSLTVPRKSFTVVTSIENVLCSSIGFSSIVNVFSVITRKFKRRESDKMIRNHKLVKGKSEYKCFNCGKIIPVGVEHYSKQYVSEELREYFLHRGSDGFGFAYITLRFCSEQCTEEIYKFSKNRSQFLNKAINDEVERVKQSRALVYAEDDRVKQMGNVKVANLKLLE